MLSYFFTNALRLLIGLRLIARRMNFVIEKKLFLLVLFVSGLSTIVQGVSGPNLVSQGIEIILVTVISWYYLRKNVNYCLFLSFFYEVAIGLWDFLVQAGLGILFHSYNYVNGIAVESLVGIWIVRLIILGILILYSKKSEEPLWIMRVTSIFAVLGLLGTLILSEQKIITLNEQKTGEWTILSMVWLISVLFNRLNHQREVEKNIIKLKQERAEILERDYLSLRCIYSDNAKLYHDLHNHIELIYQCLMEGENEEAKRYCENLRVPIYEISKIVRTGDKVVDHFINSKIAMAEQKNIRTKINVEYPHNTNIRNVDLIAILGNLLDNALEASEVAPEDLRFINLTIRRINYMLIVKVENGYEKDPVQIKGTLRTTKTEDNFHGWGMKSIRTAAERYDGIMDVEYKNGIFKVVVMLAFQPIKHD